MGIIKISEFLDNEILLGCVLIPMDQRSAANSQTS